MYVRTQYDCASGVPNYTKNTVVFTTRIFSVQYADIVSASELENVD